jgi:hypothetical protein
MGDNTSEAEFQGFSEPEPEEAPAADEEDDEERHNNLADLGVDEIRNECE